MPVLSGQSSAKANRFFPKFVFSGDKTYNPDAGYKKISGARYHRKSDKLLSKRETSQSVRFCQLEKEFFRAANPVAGKILSEALSADAFEGRRFAVEPIFGTSEIIACELLSRPQGKNGEVFSIQDISDESNSQNLSIALDRLTIANAMKLKPKYPITINISVETALSAEFWNEMVPHFARLDPETIIFEILEHEINDIHADISHLMALKHMGYRFALDDFGTAPNDAKRLSLFKETLDFIKIDGTYVQSSLSTTPKVLEKYIMHLKRQNPGIRVIAEHVQDAEQAKTLFEMGFDGVQGRNLNKKDFPYT